MLFRGKKSSVENERDWVDDATDLIERVLDGVRDKAVVPLTTLARAIVYGILAGIVGVAALVVAAILLVRLLDIYLDNIPGAPEGVWLAHLVAGAIFVVFGALMWSKRAPKRTADQR